MFLWIVVAVLAAGALCVAYGVLVEHRWYRVQRYRLDILPADGSADLTVLHLSDLHFLRRDRRKRAFLARIPQPDVTVVTGDLLGEPEAVDEVVDALRPLRGRHASWFVLGSNDYYQPEFRNYLSYFLKPRRRHRRAKRGRAADLVRALEADGWVHLQNLRTQASIDGSGWEVVGMDDPHIHRHDLRVAPRATPDRFGLAVVHSPDPAAELSALGYNLIVAGHTHGGQVRLPFVGALVTNATVPRRLAAGMHRLGASYLHVSPGIGTSKYAPFRFLCRPEATVIELRQAPETAFSKTAS